MANQGQIESWDRQKRLNWVREQQLMKMIMASDGVNEAESTLLR